jgi:hypothetical protein
MCRFPLTAVRRPVQCSALPQQPRVELLEVVVVVTPDVVRQLMHQCVPDAQVPPESLRTRRTQSVCLAGWLAPRGAHAPHAGTAHGLRPGHRTTTVLMSLGWTHLKVVSAEPQADLLAPVDVVPQHAHRRNAHLPLQRLELGWSKDLRVPGCPKAVRTVRIMPSWQIVMAKKPPHLILESPVVPHMVPLCELHMTNCIISFQQYMLGPPHLWRHLTEQPDPPPMVAHDANDACHQKTDRQTDRQTSTPA